MYIMQHNSFVSGHICDGKSGLGFTSGVGNFVHEMMKKSFRSHG